jgi:pimeloyl-ACP methyl ester carboxylesterase
MSHWRTDEIDVEGVEAHLVRPEAATGAAVLFLHWFDEAPNANRSQFLGEAQDLARLGVTSLLPQLTFPWNPPPTDAASDLRRIEEEVDRLERASDLLVGMDGVDPARLILVGHDFGAMHGMGLFGRVAFAGAVLIAPTPRWSDWFLTFWPIESDRWDYMRTLHPVDPIVTIGAASCPLLFQFGKTDFYIAPMTGLELFQAAAEPKELETYETGHAMDLSQVRTDRTGFIARVLGLD